jgi:arylsulfatase A-like enzyme
LERRTFLQTSAATLAALGAQRVFHPQASARAGNAQKRRPNILMITCHDIGQHIGCYGVKTVQTPNLDRLAARGIRFANYFATDCVCSPSRGCILTGRYPQANGLMGLTHQPWNWRLNEGERHLAAILKDAGYATTVVGLQHVTQGDPRELGYDKVLSPKRIANETVRAARRELRHARRGQQPFFMKVGFFEVHRPFTVGKDTEKGVAIPHHLQDTPETRADLAKFQATIRFFDRCVGQILETLEAGDVARDTLVIFTADHGIPYPGAKWTLFDPGIQTPLIMHQPGTTLAGGRVFEQLMSNVDFLPTLLDLVGVDKPDNLHGLSFRGVIDGSRADSPRREVYAQRTSHALYDNLSRCVRTERYKLIRYFEPGRTVIYPTDAVPQKVAQHVERPRRKPGQRPVVELYDLQTDPHERDNLAQRPEHAQTVRDLSDRLWAWMERVGDPLLAGPLRTPYYEEAMQDYHNRFHRP